MELPDNLRKLWRRLTLPNRIGNWSLTGLRQRPVKTGGRGVKRALQILSGFRWAPCQARTMSARVLPGGT